MVVATARITLHIPWAQSLKEKRMVTRSVTTKIQDRFNVSIAEVGNQDLHQLAEFGVACVAADTALADSMLEHVICFLENRTDAEITNIVREMR